MSPEEILIAKVQDSLDNVAARIATESERVAELPASKEKKMLTDVTALVGLYELRTTLTEVYDSLLELHSEGNKLREERDDARRRDCLAKAKSVYGAVGYVMVAAASAYGREAALALWPDSQLNLFAPYGLSATHFVAQAHALLDNAFPPPVAAAG